MNLPVTYSNRITGRDRERFIQRIFSSAITEESGEKYAQKRTRTSMTLRRQPLKLVCLPIPPSGQRKSFYLVIGAVATEDEAAEAEAKEELGGLSVVELVACSVFVSVDEVSKVEVSFAALLVADDEVAVAEELFASAATGLAAIGPAALSATPLKSRPSAGEPGFACTPK